AAQRRAAGKPGLAVGWGAIGDAGMLARDRKLAQRLRRTTGVAPLAAGEALAHLGRLLALGPAAAPIQVYAQIAPSAAAEKMKLMRGPSLADLGLARAEEGRDGAGDLVALIEGKSDEEARPLALAALRRELAHILRVPEESIDVTRPLGELGLDSLMALELQMSVEQLTGAEIPLMGAGDRKLGELAGMVVAALRGAGEADAAAGASDAPGTLLAVMAERHGSGQVTAQEKQAVQRALAEAKRGE
ncbi:MAG: hypothetical protein JNK46_16455, partial [Methylobacteriaceae bacterium]|nr:hypothetical protein [Methylobacteriaceae bacterium]